MLIAFNFFLLLFSGMFCVSVYHVFANQKNKVLILNKPNGHHEIGLMDMFENVKYYLYTGEHYVDRLSFKKVEARKQKQLEVYYQRYKNV